MRRREFITLFCGTAIAGPLKARAQQAIPVIGFLNAASSEAYAPYVAAFRDGLKQSGYTEDQNVAIEFRWAEGRYDRLPDMAADFVRRPVSVIVANTPAHLAAKAATSAIPIVFTTGSDPVQIGLVPSIEALSAVVNGSVPPPSRLVVQFKKRHHERPSETLEDNVAARYGARFTRPALRASTDIPVIATRF